VFFSATMPKPIMDLTKKFQNNPEVVKVLRKELTVENITQEYYEVKPSMKIELMHRLMNLHQVNLAVVFCNTKRSTDEVTESLIARGIQAEALHGDLSQAQRTKVMNKFRKGHCKVLVATDVAARGIDVDNVEVVFNYDLPLDEENYVHRIGRTGRAGKSGKAISFITGRKDMFRVKDLEKFIKTSITKMAPPSAVDLVELKKEQFVKEIYRQLSAEGDTQVYEETIGQLLTEGLSLEQITLALMKMQLGNSLDTKSEQSFELDLGRGGDRGDRGSSRRGERSDRGDRGDRGGRFERGGRDGGRDGGREKGKFGGSSREKGSREPNMARLFLNLGKKDRIRPNDIVGAIAGETGVPGRSIGGIDIFDNFSFVDVPSKDAAHVIDVMNTNTIKGKAVSIELSKG